MGFKPFSTFPVALLIGSAPIGVPLAWADMLVIEGDAQVIDTSTVEIWGQRIRLSGIAAPDPASPEGEKGRRFLQGLIAGVRLRCKVREAPLRTEMLGHCFAAKVDLAGRLVQMGYARALPGEPVRVDPQAESAERRSSMGNTPTQR
jgi:endonuclease YncB( thermonuclease family)